MLIQSNFNLDYNLAPDCWHSEVETEDDEQYYFTYKGEYGCVVGYFNSKEEAAVIDKYMDISYQGTMQFILHGNHTHGEIKVIRENVLGEVVIPFFILNQSSIMLSRKRSKRK